MQTATQNKEGKGTGFQSQGSECGCEEQETSFAGAAMQKVGNLAKEAGAAVANKANQAVAATGRGIEQVAEGIREHTPDDGVLGKASNRVADSLQSGGKYLEEHRMDAMCRDLTGVIRSNPLMSIAIAVGAGFLLARATTARSA